MEVMHERIMSLIPGRHGGVKEFAEKVGVPANLVSMWRKGDSASYKNYLPQISAAYGVSIDWLCGNSQKNNPPAKSEGLSEVKIEFMDAVKQMSDDRVLHLMYVLGLKKENPTE